MQQLLFAFMFTCLLCVTVSAHVLDEYVQATQITLAPNGIGAELHLTPGVHIADRIFKLIDLDHNGQISPAEAEGYAGSVLKGIALEVDGQRLPLTMTRFQLPSRSEMKEGVAVIRLDVWANCFLSQGEHQLDFRNEHLPQLSAYLVNVLVPKDDTIAIDAQQRDVLQHQLQATFRVNSTETPATAVRSPWPRLLLIAPALALLCVMWRALRLFFPAP